MQALLNGAHGEKSCVYLALDALLGAKWDFEGRRFCADIIKEYNGYPSAWNYIIPEFAPVKLLGDVVIDYKQPNVYATICDDDGWTYRVFRNTLAVIMYEYECDGKIYGHATCTAIRNLNELRATRFIAVFVPQGTLMIRTRT